MLLSGGGLAVVVGVFAQADIDIVAILALAVAFVTLALIVVPLTLVFVALLLRVVGLAARLRLGRLFRLVRHA
ncbi:hypothetical protein BG58_33210 [Caballeronia jiangsuensis]|nr:hypothetical protein BG58_33210 [Caballeronia jiangsuensis]